MAWLDDPGRLRSTVLGGALAVWACVGPAACAPKGSDVDDGSPGEDSLPGVDLDILCEDREAIVSGPTCGNGSQDPGEICFARTQELEVPYPYAVAHGDIDEDGAVDLVVSGPYRLHVYWGGGADLLADVSSYPFDPQGIFTVADANGDGHLDIVGFRESTDQETTIIRLLGDGTRELGTSKLDVAEASPKLFFFAGDVDGDGFDDLVVSGRAPDDHSPVLITAFGAEGDAALTEATVTDLSDVDECTSCSPAAVGDVETGGGLELVLLDADDELHFYSWTEDALLPHSFVTEVAPSHVAITDADGDGANDLVMGGHGSPIDGSLSLATALGDGTGSFAAEVTAPLGDCMECAASATRGRFGTEPSDRSMAVFQESTWFEGPSFTILAFAAFSDGAMRLQTCYGYEEEGLNAVDVVDLNGDGLDDLIVAIPLRLIIYESQP